MGNLQYAPDDPRVSAMSRLIGKCTRAFDRFLFDACSPRSCSILRIQYGVLLLILVVIWMLDANVWFTDAGILTSQTAQSSVSHQYWSLLFWLPATPAVVYSCLSILLLQSVLLLCGCWSRFQIACIYLWLTSFMHRNPLILDGEDTVFRLFAFFMIFMPLDYSWSLQRKLSGKEKPASPKPDAPPSAWALRLVQFEITAIYLSTSWSKWQGATWRDGTALFYVSRMDDAFGRVWLPEFLFETAWIVKACTWGALGIETLLPLLLWLPYTRRLAAVLGIAFHLMIEINMHLFLFEWIMMVGLMTFLKPGDFTKRKTTLATSPQPGSSTAGISPPEAAHSSV